MVSNDKPVTGIRRLWPAHLRARPRWTIAGLIFLILGGGLALSGVRLTLAMLIGFDAAAISSLGSVVVLFARSDSRRMRLRARAQAPGRWGVLWSSVLVCLVVMVALAVELGADHAAGTWGVIDACGSLLLSWLFFNIMFAMHYAHDYYRGPSDGSDLLQFPGTKQPDYWDFLYFAVVIGMCFQVSDVQVSCQRMRRTVLAQSVIAFFFNVVIVAITVNVVASKA
jgi:uncharacterized membrane protein